MNKFTSADRKASVPSFNIASGKAQFSTLPVHKDTTPSTRLTHFTPLQSMPQSDGIEI